jgi:hypothetical protein
VTVGYSDAWEKFAQPFKGGVLLVCFEIKEMDFAFPVV